MRARKLTKEQYAEFIIRNRRLSRVREEVLTQTLVECGWEFVDRGKTVTVHPPDQSHSRKKRLHINALEVLHLLVEEYRVRLRPVQEATGPVAEVVQEEVEAEQADTTAIVKAEIVPLPISEDQVVDLVALKNNQGVVMAVVSKMCDALEIDAQRQIEKIQERDDWLSGHMSVQLPSDSQSRKVFCLAAKDIEPWLNTINRNKVAERAKPALVKLQAECTKAIRRRFHPEEEQAEAPRSIDPLLMVIVAEMKEDRKIMLRILERLLTPAQPVVSAPAPASQGNLEEVAINAARTAAEVAVGVCEVATPGARFIRPGVYDYKGVAAYTSWKAVEIITKKLNAILSTTEPEMPSLEHHFVRYDYKPGKLTASRLNQLASIRKSINRNEMPLALDHLQEHGKAAPENRLWSEAHIDLLVPVMEVWCNIGCPDKGHVDDNGKWMWDSKLAVANLKKSGITKNAEEMVAQADVYVRMLP